MLEKLKFNKKNSAGFTLVEVFVAISVLMIGVVGSFGVLPAMIKNQTMNTDVFLASQLANEGMELVRNLRDENWLKEQPWKTGLDICTGIIDPENPDTFDGCEIGYNDLDLVKIESPQKLRFLKLDSDNFYKYNSGQDSKFRRKIVIQEVGVLLNVRVAVFWEGNGSPFIAEENFYDWM